MNDKNSLAFTTALDETGAAVPISGPNVHDILTGSTATGTKVTDGNCNNWTSNSSSTGVRGQVGHSNRMGGGAVPTSWNSAHLSANCSEAGLAGTGGRGSIYCFSAE